MGVFASIYRIMNILVIDHEKVKRANLASKLVAHGHQIDMAADLKQAIEHLQHGPYDLIFVDAINPAIGGMELLRRIKQGLQPGAHVVMMTSNGSIPLAVQAVKLGAHDFVHKPIPGEQLRSLLHEIERARSGQVDSREQSPSQIDLDNCIIGQSDAIQRVKRMIRIAARADANVLIHGETGVGKDLIASVIHGCSHRALGPFVKVGCTLLAPALIESELYGHEQGAFTGASQPRLGRFELADGGTIYLDDVDDITLPQQTKLLRVIEEKVFERVGSIDAIKADVRVIASTKCNLLDKVVDGTFRQDLYYRLDVLRLRVPPLRARRDDIPALTSHLLHRIAPDEPHQVEPAAMEILCQHEWPGNIRELYNTLERAWLVGAGLISAELLESDLLADPGSAGTNGAMVKTSTVGFKAAMEHAEKQLLVDALQTSGGNKTAAAQSLNMKPSTFRDKLSKHGLN